MTAAELHSLSGLLRGAAELAHAAGLDGFDDYAEAGDVIESLAQRRPLLEPDEAERLELNGDLRQLAFHLGEELAVQSGAGGVDRAALAGSLRFMRRHIARVRQEYVERRHLLLPPEDRELTTGLARLTRTTYQRRFAALYEASGYRRPFVDKLYRDYALVGLPDGLLAELDAIASRDAYDVYLCVLKGALGYALALELCGVPAERFRHVVCGRASGSHYDSVYVAEPVDFAASELRARSVLVLENNVATGRTLVRLTRTLQDARPARLGLFLDYRVPGFDGLRVEPYAAVHIGPYADSVDDSDAARALKRRLLAALRKRLDPAASAAAR